MCIKIFRQGYEFDVGIHYIGEMSTDKVNRTLVDQITDGQVQWDKLDEEFDIVSIGIFYYFFIYKMINNYFFKFINTSQITDVKNCVRYTNSLLS